MHNYYKTNEIKLANSEYIAKELRNRIIGQLKITQKETVRICKEKLNLYATQSMARRTKARVLDSHARVLDSHTGQYKEEYGFL